MANTTNSTYLSNFFKVTKEIFERILMSDNWFPNRDMSRLAQKAWEELKPKFAQLEVDVTTVDNDVLKGVGLSECQLAFKMYVFDWHLKNRNIKKALGAINTILGSLISSFPAAEPIKEFKDFLEPGNKEDLNSEPRKKPFNNPHKNI